MDIKKDTREGIFPILALSWAFRQINAVHSKDGGPGLFRYQLNPFPA